ncbi:MAG TPA: zf-HC2 domain-containing protein [Planctomycetota bacterium]|nr:zf-HC2 domain-containing protein [Planctomycetota bacterium]
MKCDDAMKGSAGRALDELEPDEKKEFEEHLAGCSSCRAGAELDRRTVAALRADGVEPSEARRARAVSAMLAASRELPKTTTRRRWIAMSVAAALAVSVAVPMLLGSRGLRANRVDGAAWIQRAGSREYVPLRLGDTLAAGDWLKTESVVGLEGPGGLKIVVNRNSRIAYDGERRRVHLAEGAIFVESPERELTVDDPSDRRAILRDGSAEIWLPLVASPSGEKKSEFAVHVEKGDVRISGAKGARDAKGGEQWSVDGQGKIQDEKPRMLAPWRKKP